MNLWKSLASVNISLIITQKTTFPKKQVFKNNLNYYYKQKLFLF